MKERKNWLNFFEIKKKIDPRKYFSKICRKKYNKIKKINIQQGSILILLNKKFQGKKAILLKMAHSNLCVITGPFSLNGISLRRINPRYVIPTGHKINIDKIELTNLDDSYFLFLKKLQKSQNLHNKTRIISSHYLRQISIDKEILELLKKKYFFSYYLKTSTLFFPNNHIFQRTTI